MLIVTRDLEKTYSVGGTPFRALRGVDLDIDAGEMVVVVGRSGSGKSTLLNLIAGLDRPTRGQLSVAGVALGALDEDALARFRGRSVGVVFQFFQLLPTLTALENILLAMDFVGVVPPGEREQRGLALLERVGVAEQAHKLPATLSGGQQQRVAVARALANDPQLIVADEPTGNLDSDTARQVMDLLSEVNEAGKTVLLVTHDAESAPKRGRILTMSDGSVA